MVDKLQPSSKAHWASKFFTSVALTGWMLLFVLKPAISKNNTELKAELMQTLKEHSVKEWKIVEADTKNTAKFEQAKDSITTNDVLTFAVNNVDTYYPDMKEHLETMLNSFRDEEHKEAVTKLLSEMAANIQDPKQKIGAIILALEFMLPWNTIFSDTYDADITDESFQYIEKLDTDYKARFKWYYQRLEEKTAQLKKKLQESQQELEEAQKEFEEVQKELEITMQWFSPEDVKNNSSIKNLVIEIQNIYQTFSIIPSEHMKSLFDVSK